MGDFVRKQIAIPVDDLPRDDRDCFCCSTTYGQLQAEGMIEYAVQLECGHLIGSVCLTTWLGHSNSCPHCRKQLFPQTHQIHENEADLVETTIGEEATRLLDHFEATREPTEDEVDETEATGGAEFSQDSSIGEQSAHHWRSAAIRRRADVYTRNLYDIVRIDQIQTGVREEDLLPVLQPSEVIGGVLGWETDRALFRQLQVRGAFRIPGMEDEKRTPPNMSDEVLYDRLRNGGARFHIARHGWFRFGKRILFNEVSPDLSAAEQQFEQSIEQNAFRTLGITRSFRDVGILFPGEDRLTPTDYEIWRTVQRDGAHFHANLRCWFSPMHEPLYGDVPFPASTLQEIIWKDTSTGYLSARAGANANVLAYVENLWLATQR